MIEFDEPAKKASDKLFNSINGRDCKNCINDSRNGCVSWDCNFISRKEAREAVKLMRERGRDCKECIVRKLDDLDAIAGQIEEDKDE